MFALVFSFLLIFNFSILTHCRFGVCKSEEQAEYRKQYINRGWIIHSGNDGLCALHADCAVLTRIPQVAVRASGLHEMSCISDVHG